jgi:DNA-binding transcriptional LysR family regulator
MELRHLRYFLAVAEELSFRGAAARLQIAQPPLSRQIRDLELEIGVKLLERNQRNVLLTKAGKSFLQDVKILLHQVDCAVTTAQKIHQNQTGLLSIAYNRAASYQIIPQLLRALAVSELQIQAIEMDNDRLLAALQQQQIDVAIGYLPLVKPVDAQWGEEIRPDDVALSHITSSVGNLQKQAHLGNALALPEPGTHWVAIQSEKLLMALPTSLENSPDQTAPPTHPELKGKLDFIAGKALILPPYLWDRNDGEKQAFLDLLKSRGIEPSHIREVADRETALSFVSNNLGVTIVPSSMGCLDKKGIIYRELFENYPKLEARAFWKSGNHSLSLGNLITAIGSWLGREIEAE